MYRAASTLFVRGGVVNQELGDVFSPGSLNQISTWARWLSRLDVERREFLISKVCNRRGCVCHLRMCLLAGVVLCKIPHVHGFKARVRVDGRRVRLACLAKCLNPKFDKSSLVGYLLFESSSDFIEVSSRARSRDGTDNLDVEVMIDRLMLRRRLPWKDLDRREQGRRTRKAALPEQV